MAGWYDLPVEIVDKILTWLSDILVAEYPANIKWRSIQDNSPSIRQFPQQFHQFNNAIRTCRHFHEILSNSSVTTSCHDRLQTVAYIKLQQAITDDFNSLRMSRHIENELISSVGLFWRNPVILDDLGLIRSLLVAGLPSESRLSLIPKLRRWIFLHLTLNSKYPTKRVILEFRGSIFERDILEFQAGPICIPRSELLEICSIESITRSSKQGIPVKDDTKSIRLPVTAGYQRGCTLLILVSTIRISGTWCLELGLY